LTSTIYRYLAGAPPFGSNARLEEFVKRCQAVKENAQDLNVYVASIEVASIDRPVQIDAETYIANRVNDQIDYYRPQAMGKARIGRRLHDFEFTIGMLSVVLGAIASVAFVTKSHWIRGLGPWVAVVTSAGAAVTAHLAAMRYEQDAMIYLGTAANLANLRDTFLAISENQQSDFAKFVNDCENVISTENGAWLAEWMRDSSKK